jgi:acyl dehydratase
VHFDELVSGRIIELGPVSLTEREIIDFARVYDTQWFHTDAERAGAGPWKGLIASGWQTCGLAMRLVCDHILAGSESIGSPGLAYLKWESPVRAGDALRVAVDVLDNRTSKSNPALGIVRWRWRMSNQHGQPVLDLEATSLFDLQSSGLSANARA